MNITFSAISVDFCGGDGDGGKFELKREEEKKKHNRVKVYVGTMN